MDLRLGQEIQLVLSNSLVAAGMVIVLRLGHRDIAQLPTFSHDRGMSNLSKLSQPSNANSISVTVLGNFIVVKF
jgi:hypothetical protein